MPKSANVRVVKYFLILSLFFVVSHGICRAQAPVNDDREAAISISPGVQIAEDLTEATLEDGEETAAQGIVKSIWYEWTSEVNGRWEWRISSDNANSRTTVYEIGEDGQPVLLARSGFYQSEYDSDNPNEYPGSRGTRFQAVAGISYLFQVQAYNTSNVTFTATLKALGPGPAADDFASATSLPGTPTRLPIDFQFASLQSGEPATELPASVWRTWQVPATGFWSLSMYGLDRDGIDVWRGDSLADLESAVVAGGAELGGGLTVVRAVAGEILRVRLLAESDSERYLTIKETTRGDMFDDAINLGTALEPESVRSFSDPVTLELGEAALERGSQWFAWQVPQNGVYEFRNFIPSTSGNGFNVYPRSEARLIIYEGEKVDDLISPASIPTGTTQRVERFLLQEGQNLKIRVSVASDGLYIGYDGGGFSSFGFPSEVQFATKFLGLPPSNDDFANADDLGKERFANTAGTTIAATDEESEPLERNDYSGRLRQGDTVWTKWTAPENGDFELRMESEARVMPELFRGTELATLEKLQVRDYIPNRYRGFRISVLEDEVYYIRIRGDGYGSQGNYEINVQPLDRPVNDDIANAVELLGELPLSDSGTTKFASEESPLEVYELSNSSSASVWWKWTALETGFYEIRSNTQLHLMEDGRKYGKYFSATSSTLRFQGLAGSEYHFRVFTGRTTEGPVTLSLREISGLSHTTPETALAAPDSMTFTTESELALDGAVLIDNKSTQGAVWYRWTPPSTGWVRITSRTSSGFSSVGVYQEGDFQTRLLGTSSSGQSGQKYRRGSLYNFHGGESSTGLFDNFVMSEASQIPYISEGLMRVEAGKIYYLVGTASATGAVQEPEQGDVTLQVERVARPPQFSGAADHFDYQLSQGGSVLHGTIPLDSPNGFLGGSINVGGRSVIFDERDRIRGDLFAGDYRVAIPWRPTSGSLTENPSLSMWDRAGGGGYYRWTNVVIEPLADEEIEKDLSGPVLVNTRGAPMALALTDEATTLELELAISDFGGSGFLKGEVIVPVGPVGEYRPIYSVDFNLVPRYFLSNYGAANERRISFGPEDRIRGDEAVGIYRVTVPIPAFNPPGQLICHLQDHAGNLGGQWITSGGEVQSSRFQAGVSFPVTLTREGSEDPEAAVIEKVEVALAAGEITSRASLAHPLGIAGGQVILFDERGTVVASVNVSESDRVEGSALAGIYEVNLPIPTTGYGGAHWLTWRALGADGGVGELAMAGQVVLSDRSLVDARLPSLTRFEVNPQVLDLAAGASEVTFILAANDDRVGITAEITVLDSGGQELGREVVECPDAWMDCEVVMPLPQVDAVGSSAAAQVILKLRDTAGREAVYGRVLGQPWPDVEAAKLWLSDEDPTFSEHWRRIWGIMNNFADDLDSDGDGESDLMEFAAGTDPLTPSPQDLLARRRPVLDITNNVFGSSGLERSLNFSFQYAPWFGFQDLKLRGEEFEIVVERSPDLANWEAVKISGADQGYAKIFSYVPQSTPAYWMRLRVKSP